MAGFPDNRATTLVPAGSLAVGDVILVKPGEAIAADSVIVEGTSALDLSLLTGESAAQRRETGEQVPGGAINASAALILRVLKPARESTLSDLLKLIERAGSGKPQIAQWADKVAAWFVLGLLLFAVAVFAFWSWHDPSQAWPVAIAVLVVSCPCALSLATPTALAAATDSLLRRGVLIVQPHVLETLHRATHIVFDKTGTLTLGRPVLRQIEGLGSLSDDACLQVAAALEAGSAHPLAQAILAAADGLPRQQPRAHAEQLQEVQGQGLEGMRRRRALPPGQCGLCRRHRRAAAGRHGRRHAGHDAAVPGHAGTLAHALPAQRCAAPGSARRGRVFPAGAASRSCCSAATRKR